MKTRLPLFTAVLILALGLCFILIWSISLYISVEQDQQFWLLWRQQIIPVSLLVLAISAFVYFQISRGLIKPTQRLAFRMYKLVNRKNPHRGDSNQSLTIGLAELEDYYKTLEQMATEDTVTGLNNRVIFEDRLQQAVSEGKRSGRKYALLLIQLENVESLAKRHGQHIADTLLKQVANRVSDGLRESDNVSHFEKSIFALLLEVQDEHQLVGLVEKIHAELSAAYSAYGRNFELSVSLGVSLYPAQAATADKLYQHALSALVSAQDEESQIVFYEDSRKADLSGYTLVQSLRNAIDNQEFKLVFQPVVKLIDKRTVYFEALLRWKNAQMHHTSIERTIHLAEKNQLIQPLTNWIVESVCQTLSHLKIDDLVIGINLSMLDLHDHYLPRRIETCLKKYAIDPNKIMIEITEGQIMQEPEQVAEILAHLGVMGLSLSIDDFGTGQASLTYLKKLPVEKLKIDQSFIRDMVKSADDRLIVKATIELAHTLDLEVVAEGVESAEISDMLGELNCDYAQGYFISRPLEAEQIEDWLRQ